MKTLAEIGWARAPRFGFFTAAMLPYRLLPVPQLRAPWLRLLGARIGRGTIVHDVRFFNPYRRGLGGREVADECFLGDACLLDLAEGIKLERQATLPRAGGSGRGRTVLLHWGERDALAGNPHRRPVVRRGRHVVTANVPPGTLVVDVPARVVRQLG